MKKILTLLSLMLVSVIPLGVSADETTTSEDTSTAEQSTNTSTSSDTTEDADMPEAKKKIMAEHKKKLAEELKALKEKKKVETGENREEMKDNLKVFRQENGSPKAAFVDLSDEVKTEVKALKEKHKTEMEALVASFKAQEKTEENIKAHRAAVEALRQKHFDELQALVGDDAKASEFVAKREEIFQENKVLREENMKARIEFRGERSELVSKYKEAFAKRLIEKLPKMSSDKLEKLLVRIESNITKLEANTRTTTEAKDKIISQLISLKELIEEEIENKSSSEEEIDIEAILAE